MLWLALWIAVVFGGLFAWMAHEKRRDDAARRMLEEEQAEQAAARKAAIRSAVPLIPPPVLPAFDDVGRVVATLEVEFDELRSFADIEKWDDAATAAVERISEILRAVDSYGDAADEAMRVPGAGWAAIERTHQAVRELTGFVKPLRDAYDSLTERIDMTPDNRKDQAAALRELRAEKKELQIQKRELKSAAAELRREVKTVATNLGKGDWTRYQRAVTAESRRALRRQAAAMLRPQEDAAAALDRQINALDRRIAWVAQFGDE